MVFPYKGHTHSFSRFPSEHTCYQLAQEAEKGHGGGNDGEEEPRVQKEGSSLPSNKEHSPQTTVFTCNNRYNKLVYCTQLS